MALTLKIVDDNTTVAADVAVLEKMDYFKQMLAAGMRERSSGQVELRDVDTATVKRLLDYLKMPNSDKLAEIPVLELCQLHLFADRLMYADLKQACADLLADCLNDVTARDVVDYLMMGVPDDRLSKALVEYVCQSPIFQRDIVPVLSEEEFKFIQGLELPESTKMLMALAYPQLDAATRQKVYYWITEASDGDLAEMVDQLMVRPSPDLTVQSLILSRLRPLIKTRPYPAGFHVVQLVDFDARKLSLAPPMLHDLYVRGGHHVLYTTVTLLYDGRDDWVLELPTFRFPGLTETPSPDDKRLLTLRLRHTNIGPDLSPTERSALGVRLNQVLTNLHATVMAKLFEIRHALRLNVNDVAEIRQLLPPLVKIRHPDHGAPPVVNPDQDYFIYMKIKPSTVFRDHHTNHMLHPNSLIGTAVNLAEPYTMNRGLLRVSRIYCGRHNYAIQSEFAHGYVDRPNQPTHQPVQPTHQPVQPTHQPVQPTHQPVLPVLSVQP